MKNLLHEDIWMSLDEISNVDEVSTGLMSYKLDFSSDEVPSVLQGEFWKGVYDFHYFWSFDIVDSQGVKETNEIGNLWSKNSSGVHANI